MLSKGQAGLKKFGNVDPSSWNAEGDARPVRTNVNCTWSLGTQRTIRSNGTNSRD